MNKILESQIVEFDNLVCQMMKRLNAKHPGWVEENDLTEAQFVTGMHIKQLGHPKMSELAETMGVNLSTLTGIVDRMVKSGYVQRERDETDRRLVKVFLTEVGENAIYKLHQLKHNQLQSMILALNDEDRETFLNLLGKLVEGLKEKESNLDKDQKPDIHSD